MCVAESLQLHKLESLNLQGGVWQPSLLLLFVQQAVNLRLLKASSRHLDDVTLKRLTQLQSLQELQLKGDCLVTDSGLFQLARSSTLTRVVIQGCWLVTEVGMRQAADQGCWEYVQWNGVVPANSQTHVTKGAVSHTMSKATLQQYDDRLKYTKEDLLQLYAAVCNDNTPYDFPSQLPTELLRVATGADRGA